MPSHFDSLPIALHPQSASPMVLLEKWCCWKSGAVRKVVVLEKASGGENHEI